MKKLIILFVLLLILVGSMLFLLIAPRLTDKITEKKLTEYTHTKAICDKNNYCQDYEITCNKNTLIRSTPITGAAVQHSPDWKDPRDNASALCE